jgi:uncharacterized membrane protein YqgA involved in biofilm formation
MIAMPPEFYDYAYKIVLIVSCVVGAVSIGIMCNCEEKFATFLDKMFDISDDS